MSQAASDPTDGYIRGGRGAVVEPRVVLHVAAAATIAILITLVVVFSVLAARSSSRADRLRHSGVAVTATVTGCQGISSGVGQGIEFWQCGGQFKLDGRQYSASIGGSRTQLATGSTVPAVVVPGDPSSLTLASKVGQASENWTAPIVLGAITLVSLAGYLFWWRLRRWGEGSRPIVSAPSSHEVTGQ